MNSIKTIEFTLPECWASALLYDDYSGLSNSEARDVDGFEAWAKTQGVTGPCMGCTSKPEFRHIHDWSDVIGAADCLTYTFPA